MNFHYDTLNYDCQTLGLFGYQPKTWSNDYTRLITIGEWVVCFKF